MAKRSVAKKGVIGSVTGNPRGGGSRRWALKHWHSLGAQVYPQEQRIFEESLPTLIRDWVLPGHVPEQGTLSASDGVIALGSCFARELRAFLERAGVSSGMFWVPSDLNNTYAIRDFVSWCVTGRETPRGFSYTRTEDGEIQEWTPEAERTRYRESLERAGAFVFTFGLAEAWEDKETGGVFWRGIPADLFDADRYVFRLTTVEENEENIRQIVELVRSVNQTAPIVLTLSPVPLKATFRGISCLTADCVSKATLRVALDRVIEAKPDNVYYWPAFEVVRWVGSNLPSAAFGVDDGRSRHVSRTLVTEIIAAFLGAFYTPAAVAELHARVIEREQSKPRKSSETRGKATRRPRARRASAATQRVLQVLRGGSRS